MSKTYCPYPFASASLQADNTVLPCGQFMKSTLFKKIIPINEVRTGAVMNEMRRQMLNDEQPEGCQCFAEEAVGIKSMRQHGIDTFGYQEDLKLRKLELVFDNVCNVKCRSCGSVNSHLWYEDEIALYGQAILQRKYSKNTLYADLDTTYLEEIEVLGGEPMVSPGAADYFKILNEKGVFKNIRIKLSTNGVVAPTGDMLAGLLECKHLHLNVSIDAFGTYNTYVRGGADFDLIDTNLKFYNELIDKRGTNTTIMVHTVVSIYNANQLDILENYIKEHYPRFQLSYQVAQFPVFLSIKNTPQEYKDAIRPLLNDDGIVSYLDSEGEDYFGHFVNFTKKLDAIRNENIGNNNPFLVDFMSSYPIVDSKQFFKEAIKNLTS